MASGSENRRGAWYASRLGAAVCGTVLLACLTLLLFVNLRAEPPGRISEARSTSVAREMVLSGDWLAPLRGRSMRLQNPPLFYWAGAATATALGDTGPIAVRLPSALSSIALVALVMFWGRSLGGAGTGLAAGAALACTIQLAVSGRRGDLEMLFALLCAAALFTFDRLHAGRNPRLLPLFGVLAGLAFLTKATAAILVVALPILLFIALQGELRRLREPRVLGACALAFAIGLSWYAVVLARVPGALEAPWQNLILPFGAGRPVNPNSAHFPPIWWYLEILPVRAAPAILLLPVAAWRLFTTGLYRDEPRKRFAALAFLVPLIAFSLLPQKQRHYTLVMLPGMAIVSAEAVRALAPHARAWLVRVAGTPLALAGLAGTGLVALFFVWIEALSPFGVAAGALALGGLFALSLVSALRGRLSGFALAWVPAFLLVFTLQLAVIKVRVDRVAREGVGSLTLDERERLYRVAREQPWFTDLFRLASRVTPEI